MRHLALLALLTLSGCSYGFPMAYWSHAYLESRDYDHSPAVPVPQFIKDEAANDKRR